MSKSPFTTILGTLEKPVETREGGFITTRFSLRVDPARRLQVATYLDTLPTHDLADVPSGPVTLLIDKSVSGALVDQGRCLIAAQGKVARGTNYGDLLIPKGGRGATGFHITGRIVGVIKGYANLDNLTATHEDAVAARVAATSDALNALALTPGDGDAIRLTLTGTLPFFGGDVPGATWHLTGYDPLDDIADGYLVVPPNTLGAVSEHGSAYGRDLLNSYTPARTPEGLTFTALVKEDTPLAVA